MTAKHTIKDVTIYFATESILKGQLQITAA